ncbi:protein FAM83C [Protopterus annectens]|uniref:protein FAM83C n=1 Tax=Protopterus annectens TaxID=7888 RepID=UPI001CFB0B21|nr:protein FAM83C [Protopterus annectens]
MLTSDALRPSTTPSRKGPGKMWARLEDLKNPWRQGLTMELSHNESARLATDALLQSGEQAYQRTLKEEKELPFLSRTEINYITENATGNNSSPGMEPNKRYSLNGSIDGDCLSEQTSGTYFPMMSDTEPPVLELGWPESYTAKYAPTEVYAYFQNDRSSSLKDMIRSLINRAKTLIAVVMDLFTDVDLLLDLLEASLKRKIPVYVLLDEKNMEYFKEMCKNLDITSAILSNFKIRSVSGDTYCTKSGQKFTGQMLQKFMIIDCEHVVAGSYSFTWLSGQVHSSMVVHLKGKIIEQFDREFRCLYADSKVIDCFSNPNDESAEFPYCRPKIYQTHTLPETSIDTVLSNPSSSLSSSSQNSVKRMPLNTSTFIVPHEQKGPKTHFINSEMRSTSPPYNHDRGSNGNINFPVHGEKTALASGQIFQPKILGPGMPASNTSTLNSVQSRIFELESNQKQTPRGVFFRKNGGDTPLPKDRDKHGVIKPSQQTVDKDGALEDTDYQTSVNSGGPGFSQEDRKCDLKRDEKRMTLGHSKLEMVKNFNLKHPKKVYSRFEGTSQ